MTKRKVAASGTLRIIAGEARGRKIATPGWDGLRPTSDRLRETLFNIIATRVPGASVLDGYSGTGALGIEALSRGAKDVTFIERDPRAVALIRANLERVGMQAPAKAYKIIRGPFTETIADNDSTLFDLVLLDPPYDDPALDAALVAAGHILRDDGLVALEHATRVAPPEVACLVLTRTVKAGDSSLSFYVCRD